MDTPLPALSGTPTLREALYTFVHQWDFEHPSERRAWVDEMAGAILGRRVPIRRVYVPLVRR